MGSKHKLAPRLGELFATLPPGPAIDAFSGSGVVAYTLKAGGREVLANDHLTFTATLAEALVANERVQLVPEDVERLCSDNRDGRDFIAAHVRRALLPGIRSRVPGRGVVARGRARGLAPGARAQRPVPRGGLEAAARRLHGHHAALRRRPPAAADEPRGAVPRGGAAAATRRSCRAPRVPAAATCSRSTRPAPRSSTSIRRTPRLATTRVTSSATTSSRAWRRTGAARRSCGRPARASCASATRRSAPSGRCGPHWTGCSSISRPRPTLVVSYGSNADLDATELEALLARHRRSVRRIEIPHRYAFGTHRAAGRRVATEYVFVAS